MMVLHLNFSYKAINLRLIFDFIISKFQNEQQKWMRESSCKM